MLQPFRCWKATALLIVVLVFTIFHPNSQLPSHHTSSSEPRVAIVTFTTTQQSFTYLSLKNKRAYAQRHDYDLFVDFEGSNERGTMWHKFVMVEQVIKGGEHDWVWWIDFDTLITNTSTKLTDIITDSLHGLPNPEEIDFLLTADCFPLNAGSMLMRAHPRTLEFISRVRAYGDANPDLSEQDCIRDLINLNAHNEDRHTLFIPQWKINAFPDEIRCWDEYQKGWEWGSFVLHFAGAWAHVKQDDPVGFLMRKYESQIIWD
ncbi:hypothetical protein BZG36_05721 [Bifiguratus adelaidae]|uniref:Glycosyltransferase family 34 protein n=1 Tax=Bifiguratus adelaidae TaxID=1938954 RepID=A0A261XSN9_9FUNG|nr:hypothetical protein BZG36_05721 [Bifiguratus adelaidae]